MTAATSLSDVKEQVKDKADLAGVVSKHTKLVKSTQGFKACCPLPGHKEKTPSFYVNTRDNYFYCYGCNRGGDVFTFLNLVEGLGFIDALKELAADLHIELPKTAFSKTESEAQKSERQSGYDLLGRTDKFFHRVLVEGATPGAEKAATYLKQRGISDEEITELSLGWAPESGTALLKKMQSQLDFDTAKATGLVREYGSRAYDFFQDRLMIPISDHRGRTVAFSGRTLGEVSGDNPKYKNSPESEWFKKKEILYALDRAAKLIRNENYVCIVEGYFDQWAFQRREIPAVAVMGTALTEEHLNALGRHTKQVVLVLDTDAAGINSTKKSLPLFLDHGWDVKVFSELQGKDPDEWLKDNSEGAQTIKQKLLSAPEALEWWGKLLIKEAAEQSFNRLQTQKSLIEVWRLAKTLAHKNILADELGRVLGLQPAEFKESMQELLAQTAPSKKAPIVHGVANFTEGNSSPEPSQKSSPQRRISNWDRASESVLVWWIRHWELLTPKSNEAWAEREELFLGSTAEKLVKRFGADWYRNQGELKKDVVKGLLSDENLDELLRGWILKGFVSSDMSANIEDEAKILISFNEFAGILRRESVEAQISKLQNELRALSSDTEGTAQILHKVQELRMSLEKRK